MDLHDRLQQIQALDDDALLHSLKRFVGSSNHLTALVLAHLAEVDARGAYRRWACDTLVTYCVYELRLSEDEAQRRCRAARVARQFPILFDMLADASIHLTGILMLAPYLTEENHREVLARARYRRKTEIQRLVAELAPSCDVPAVIEPLSSGRAAERARPRSGWGVMSEAAMGGVRQLVPGDGPAHAPSAPDAWRNELLHEIAREAVVPERDAAEECDAAADVAKRSGGTSRRAGAEHNPRRQLRAPPISSQWLRPPSRRPSARRATKCSSPQIRTTSSSSSALALSAGTRLPSGDLAELHRLAMQLLVEKLLRRKSAARRSEPAACGDAEAELRRAGAKRTAVVAVAGFDAAAEASFSRRARVDAIAALRSTVPCGNETVAAAPLRTTRGVRCPATTAIEFHHEQPHARGGPDTEANIALRCRAHNALAAERTLVVISCSEGRGESRRSPNVNRVRAARYRAGATTPSRADAV